MQATLALSEHDRDVPSSYRGLWRRSLLDTPTGCDTTTTVFWLQAARWHADIRIPAGRPDFRTVRRLCDCDDKQLDWLAAQQGFAGITQVREHAGRQICTWHRLVDYQPLQSVPDEGWMHFEPERLVETGVHAPYLEHWHRVPGIPASGAVFRRIDLAGQLHEPTELLLVAGQYLMRVRQRRVPLSSWPEDWHGLSLEDKVALLDVEISLGQWHANTYRVFHSTHPWLEGDQQPLALLSRDHDVAELLCNGVPTRWKVLDWRPSNEIYFES